jgi:hypothetical protein
MHRTTWQGERYAWAVDLLNHTMAIAERARKSDTAPQAVSPTTATIIERLNTMDAQLCDLDAPPALNLTIAPKEMYSQHKKCSAFSLDDSTYYGFQSSSFGPSPMGPENVASA